MADQDLRKERQLNVRQIETETLYDTFTPDLTTGEKALFDVPKGTRIVDAYVDVTPGTGTTLTVALILDDGSNKNLITGINGLSAALTRLLTGNQQLAAAAAQIKLNVTVATGVSVAATYRVMVKVKRESAV